MGASAVPERIIVGIDVGTTKVCVLVGEQDRNGKLNILGAGLCPSRGLRRGVVINMSETVESITAAIDRAERLSGRKIASAYVGVAGSHIESLKTKFSEVRIDYMLANTAEPLDRSLFSYLSARERLMRVR